MYFAAFRNMQAGEGTGELFSFDDVLWCISEYQKVNQYREGECCLVEWGSMHGISQALSSAHMALFVAMVCQQEFEAGAPADNTADIQTAWKKLWADWQKKPLRFEQIRTVKMAFVERAKSSTTTTTTYKKTFPFSPAQMATFWDTASLKTELKKVINQFTEEVLLETVKAKTGQPAWCKLLLCH